MVAHDADGALFQKTLERAVEKGIFKEPLTAVIDSSPVHGAGAVASTYELVRKMMGRLARAMGNNLDVGLAAKVLALAAAKPDIDWQIPPPAKSTWASCWGWRPRCWAVRQPTKSSWPNQRWPRRPAFCPRSCSKTWRPPKKGPLSATG